MEIEKAERFTHEIHTHTHTHTHKEILIGVHTYMNLRFRHLFPPLSSDVPQATLIRPHVRMHTQYATEAIHTHTLMYTHMSSQFQRATHRKSQAHAAKRSPTFFQFTIDQMAFK